MLFIDDFGDLIYEYIDIGKCDHDELPCNIFLSENVAEVFPCIKFQYNHKNEYLETEMSIMTIEDNPKIVGTTGELTNNEIQYLKNFIIRNKKLLMKYWNYKIDATTLAESLIY